MSNSLVPDSWCVFETVQTSKKSIYERSNPERQVKLSEMIGMNMWAKGQDYAITKDMEYPSKEWE